MDKHELLAEIAEAIHQYNQAREEAQKIIDRQKRKTVPPTPANTCFRIYEVD